VEDLSEFTLAKDLDGALEAAKYLEFSSALLDTNYTSADIGSLNAIFSTLNHLLVISDNAAVAMLHEDIIPRSIGVLSRAVKYLQPPPFEIPDEIPIDPTVETSASSSTVKVSRFAF